MKFFSLKSYVMAGAVISSMMFVGCESDKAESQHVSLDPYQTELLDLAFSGISKMPLRPHIKNRSREQLKIVDAYLELGQPEKAEALLDQIANWQRWMGTANIAYYYAENGDQKKSQMMIAMVEPALDMAEGIRTGRVVGSTPNELIDSFVDWRYQAVLARVSEVRMLNNTRDSFDGDVEKYGNVNTSMLIMNRAMSGESTIDEIMNVLRIASEDPSFEVVQLSLLKMADLLAKNYERLDIQSILSEDVEPKLAKKMPIFIQINVLSTFAKVATAHDDLDAANSLFEKIQLMVDGLASSPRVYIPEATKLAQLHYSAGQTELAAALLSKSFEIYERSEDDIISIERAQLLCRLAETYKQFGEMTQSIELYKKAVVEGQINPNSRPRAQDLNEICCSLAVNKMNPDAQLMNALKEMESKLGEPW